MPSPKERAKALIENAMLRGEQAESLPGDVRLHAKDFPAFPGEPREIDVWLADVRDGSILSFRHAAGVNDAVEHAAWLLESWG